MSDSKQETARAKVLALLAGAGDSAAPSETTHLFRDFAERHPDCCERTCVPGHFTGSAWVVSADGERALLMHHRKLGIWVQPGGHADGEGDLACVALREAQEETGLRGLRIEGGIFDLDRHLIPPRGSDPAHFHYDVRFVLRAGAEENFVLNEESHALAWRPVRGIAQDAHADGSVQRMAQKWLRRDRRIHP
jgi:8-oxo-dGTP pyrophosphatase MutT (NUDIX family)